jgi:plastocyanin
MTRSRSVAFAAFLPLLLVACGGATSDAPSDEPAASVAASQAAEPSEAVEPSEATEPSEEAGDGRQVTLTDFAFSEGELTIDLGTTVTFLNAGSAPHTATEGADGVAADDPFFNEQLAPGDEVEVTFDEAGTYEVTCLFHPQMNMTIVVEG